MHYIRIISKKKYKKKFVWTSQADQICYAVLCVFSYLAAGQDQKKQILQQAARGPDQQDPEVEDNTKPSVTPTKINQSSKSNPMAPKKMSGNDHTSNVKPGVDPNAVQADKNKMSQPVDSATAIAGGHPPPRHPPPPLIPPRQNSQSNVVNRQMSGVDASALRQNVTQHTPTRQMSQGAPPAIPPRRPSSSSAVSRHNTMPDSQDLRYVWNICQIQIIQIDSKFNAPSERCNMHDKKKLIFLTDQLRHLVCRFSQVLCRYNSNQVVAFCLKVHLEG